LAFNLLACDPLPCTHTYLRNRAESATGRTLSLASVDVLVQIHSDLHLRFATFPPARRAITVLPLPQRPRSVRIRAAPFVVFSSTASDVLHTRPCCSRANPPCTLCSGSSASSCLTCVRPALPHHSRARTHVPALLALPVLWPPSACTPARCVPLAPARAATSCSTSSRTPARARHRPALLAPAHASRAPASARSTFALAPLRPSQHRLRRSAPGPSVHTPAQPRTPARARGARLLSFPRAPELRLRVACPHHCHSAHHPSHVAPCALSWPVPPAPCTRAAPPRQPRPAPAAAPACA
jgi:hypothetical protein